MATHPLWRPYAASANADRQAARVGRRQLPPGPVEPYRKRWLDDYEAVRALVVTAIPEQVRMLRHVGSTAVPGLPAKPVVDVDLTVPAAEDEPAYLPRLEAVGFRLIFRDDLGGDVHRQLTLGAPNTNLHVWSPGAVEPRRHALFVAWLRTCATDRDRYAAAKRAAASSGGALRYNDAKSAVVYDIYERALAADPSSPHDPRPRL